LPECKVLRDISKDEREWYQSEEVEKECRHRAPPVCPTDKGERDRQKQEVDVRAGQNLQRKFKEY